MRLLILLEKELTQFLRDRVILLLILWLYTVEVVLCTYALGLDLRNLPLAVVDQDRTPVTRALVDELTRGKAFRIAGFPADMSAGERWVRDGRARALLHIPPDFTRAFTRGESPAVQVLLDGSNANTAATARSYLLLALQSLEGDAGDGARVRTALRVWYNPDLTYTRFMVLSMIALAALMVGVIHPAASIVREKEVGTIEQLKVTPVRTPELFLAKTIPTLAIGTLAVFPSLLIVWWFGVPLRGSLLLFLALTALFLFSAIGIGVLVAAVCRTLQQALLLSFLGLFPLMFLSGALAPISSMPSLLQTFSLVSPLRHYIDVILGIFLKDAGLPELWPQAAALLFLGAASFASASVIFQRQQAP